MLLTAKEIKEIKSNELKSIIEKIDIKLRFVIIQVGDNYASNKYINNKIKYAKELGLEPILKNYDINVDEATITKQIQVYNLDESIFGIIVQLPLPEHLNEQKIVQCISPNKDIDGFNVRNIGKTYIGENSLVSCTASGIITLLNYYKIDVEGKNITIAGRSNLVGKILALLFINLGATVSVCNSKTKNIKAYIDNSDIFVSAIGKAHYFTEDYFDNENLTIIDVGINFLDGKMVGDVDCPNVEKKVANITPVPGGIGVLTVVELMQNVIKAYNLTKKEIENGNNNG